MSNKIKRIITNIAIAALPFGVIALTIYWTLREMKQMDKKNGV